MVEHSCWSISTQNTHFWSIFWNRKILDSLNTTDQNQSQRLQSKSKHIKPSLMRFSWSHYIVQRGASECLFEFHCHAIGDRQYQARNFVTWRRKAAKRKAALTAGSEHLSSWHCGYIPSQDASLARERSALTERPTGKCWRLAPVETQDYMRPYSTLCARAAVYLSPLGFSSMWQDLFFSLLLL